MIDSNIKKICIISAFATIILSHGCKAQSDNYTISPVYVSIGAQTIYSNSLRQNSYLNQTPNTVYGVEAAVGILQYYDSLKAELAIDYKPNTNSSFNTSNTNISFGYTSTALMLNASYDFILNEKFVPYIKGGIGMAWNSAKDYVYKDQSMPSANTYPGATNNNFAWLAGIGMEFRHSQYIAAFLEYKYLNRGKIITQSNVTNSGVTLNAWAKQGDAAENNFMVGIKYYF
jgi:opacity protein-like surface antigen